MYTSYFSGSIEQYHNNNDHVRYEERTQSMKESIVNHIQRREGLGSVVILHHIELMPPTIVSEISQVLNGKSHSLIFQSLDNEQLVEANCNGTVFIMTSKAWGTTSIIRHVVHNNGWNVLRSRDSLTSSIRQEVDAHVDISSNTVRIVSCEILFVMLIVISPRSATQYLSASCYPSLLS